MLNLKLMLTKILSMFSISGQTTFTPAVGAPYAPYGGCHYERYGRLVHLKLGISGLTANSPNWVYQLPQAFRPSERVFGCGTAGDAVNRTTVEILTDGRISVMPSGVYCVADIYYLV